MILLLCMVKIFVNQFHQCVMSVRLKKVVNILNLRALLS